MREGDLDSQFVEAPLHYQVEAALHRPLLQGQRLDPGADYDGGIVEPVQSQDLDILQDLVAVFRVLANFGAEGLDDFDHRIDILAIGDSDIQQREGKFTGQVLD